MATKNSSWFQKFAELIVEKKKLDEAMILWKENFNVNDKENIKREFKEYLKKNDTEYNSLEEPLNENVYGNHPLHFWLDAFLASNGLLDLNFEDVLDLYNKAWKEGITEARDYFVQYLEELAQEDEFSLEALFTLETNYAQLLQNTEWPSKLEKLLESTLNKALDGNKFALFELNKCKNTYPEYFKSNIKFITETSDDVEINKNKSDTSLIKEDLLAQLLDTNPTSPKSITSISIKKQLIDEQITTLTHKINSLEKNSGDKVESLVELKEIYCELGELYSQQQNFTESFFCYSKAAAYGSGEAYFKLGELYYFGKEGKTRDVAEAISHYESAVQHGSSEASEKLKKMDKEINKVINEYNFQINLDTKNGEKTYRQCLFAASEDHKTVALLGLISKELKRLEQAGQSGKNKVTNIRKAVFNALISGEKNLLENRELIKALGSSRSFWTSKVDTTKIKNTTILTNVLHQARENIAKYKDVLCKNDPEKAKIQLQAKLDDYISLIKCELEVVKYKAPKQAKLKAAEALKLILDKKQGTLSPKQDNLFCEGKLGELVTEFNKWMGYEKKGEETPVKTLLKGLDIKEKQEQLMDNSSKILSKNSP